MKKKVVRDDGGEAFPFVIQPPPSFHGTNALIKVNGMSLLDWFAGQAAAGLLAHNCDRFDPQASAESLATRAYEVAEALVAVKRRG